MSMLEAILGLYMGLIMLITLVEFLASIGLNTLIFPSTLYEISKMNLFGCWFCFILMSIFSPILFCIKFAGFILAFLVSLSIGIFIGDLTGEKFITCSLFFDVIL